MVTLERQMAQIAKKASGSAPQEREISLEEKYVSGREEELATSSTHIRNLMRKETAQRDTETSLGDRDTNSKGRIGKKTSPKLGKRHWARP